MYIYGPSVPGKLKIIHDVRILCLYIVTSSARFKFYSNFFVNTGICKFMQVYAVLCQLIVNVLYSLSRVFSTSLIVQGVLLLLFLLVVQSVLLFLDVSARSEPSSEGGIRQQKNLGQAECWVAGLPFLCCQVTLPLMPNMLKLQPSTETLLFSYSLKFNTEVNIVIVSIPQTKLKEFGNLLICKNN